MTTHRFTSDGADIPAGQYVVTVDDDGRVSLAWRADPADMWSAPVDAS